MSTDLFTSDQIFLGLRTDLLGRRIVFLETTGSTNEDARDLAIKGEPEGTVVIADSQTSGRGRLNRQWESVAGKNVYISVILRPTVDPSRAQLATLAAGVATAEAVSEFTPIKPGLKWPNDVLIDGRKVAGILSETQGSANGLDFLIIGIGINVNAQESDFSPETAKIATSLAMVAPTLTLPRKRGRVRVRVSRVTVVQNLLARLEFWYKILQSPEPGRITDGWTKLSVNVGRAVTVRTAEGLISGRALGVDQDGSLLIETGGTVKRIVAGDVESAHASCD